MQRYIIDVREPDEYQRGHVKGALNIPPTELMHGTRKLEQLNVDDELVLYCVSGSRSNVSKQILQAKGFTNVVNGINKDHVAKTYNLELE